jgi:hypothetical protein
MKKVLLGLAVVLTVHCPLSAEMNDKVLDKLDDITKAMQGLKVDISKLEEGRRADTGMLDRLYARMESQDSRLRALESLAPALRDLAEVKKDIKSMKSEVVRMSAVLSFVWGLAGAISSLLGYFLVEKFVKSKK